MHMKITLPKKWNTNVPEGSHQAKVTDLHYSKKTVTVEYEITIGEFTERKLRRAFDLSGSGLQAFAKFLNAIQISPDTEELDPQECIGKPLTIHVSHHRKNDAVFENVTRHEPPNSAPSQRTKQTKPNEKTT